MKLTEDLLACVCVGVSAVNRYFSNYIELTGKTVCRMKKMPRTPRAERNNYVRSGEFNEIMKIPYISSRRLRVCVKETRLSLVLFH